MNCYAGIFNLEHVIPSIPVRYCNPLFSNWWPADVVFSVSADQRWSDLWARPISNDPITSCLLFPTICIHPINLKHSALPVIIMWGKTTNFDYIWSVSWSMVGWLKSERGTNTWVEWCVEMQIWGQTKAWGDTRKPFLTPDQHTPTPCHPQSTLAHCSEHCSRL